MTTDGRRSDALFVATVGYLLLPSVVFVLAWLRPWLALPAALALAACATDVWRRSREDAPPTPRPTLAFVAAFALFWTVVAGIGELNLQTEDYLKHNLVFHDLVTEPWPVRYPAAGPGGSILCYYVAYYLPASLAGKVLGLGTTAPFSFAWALGGVGLAFAWIARLGRPRGTAVLVSFMFVDSFAWLPGIVPFLRKVGVLAGGGDGQWWIADRFTEQVFSFGGLPVRLLFQSEPSALLWVPQHAIAAWLGTACVLRALEEGRSARHLGLVLAATLLWSPFVTVGLVPFALAALPRRPRRGLGWPSIVGGAVLGLPVCLYFLAHTPQQYLGLLPTLFAGPLDWLRYLGFLVASVGLLALAVAWLRRRHGIPAADEWRLFVLACAVVVAATLVYMGRHNDWAMRVAMPALVVFRLVVARSLVALWQAGARLRTRLAFAAVVLLSAERPMKVLVLAPFGKLGGQLPEASIATAERVATGLDALPSTADWDFAGQYLGTPDSLFARFLMRPARQEGRGSGQQT